MMKIMENQELWQRLAAWGCAAGDADAEAAGLEQACRRAEAYAKQFCGFEDIPADLQDVLLDLAGVYFLRSRLGATPGGDSVGVSSLKLGDVAVSFATEASGQDSTGRLELLEALEQSCKERLVRYRKISF